MANKNQSTSANLDKLISIGESLSMNPKWLPKDGKTFCNFAVATAASKFGYNKFFGPDNAPLMANEIIDRMDSDKNNWSQASADDAYASALRGQLSVAAYSENPHGHVAIVAPRTKVWSQKWLGYFPQVYNVGKTNGVMGENFAFLNRPTHYIYVS